MNDIGTDDLTILDSLQDDFLAAKDPFFFLYNTNATHIPFQISSPYIKDFKGISTRYGKALYITDRVVKTVVDDIKKKGQLDRTIFVFTADHGIYTVKRRGRLSSYFRETLDIPMMFRFPKGWIKEHPSEWKNLQANKEKLVSNLDIAPTIYNIVYGQQSKDAYFSGASLFDPVDENRDIVCLSTNDTRHWTSEGFGIYKGTKSFIFHDNTGFHFYDTATDPTQEHDLIQELSKDLRQHYDSIWLNNKYLNGVYERHKTE